MTDIVLKDIDGVLAERIKRVAEKRGWTVPKTLLHLLEQGLYAYEDGGALSFDASEEDALKAAISAMEQVEDDEGYALIGRVGREGGDP
ncbi:hypothetical protein [Luteimonas vadosa]|uniref:CopG family transcriptional regulator n=1 Tax=Luteimonas vadosa TaxID=1165507 RepID=A0ABP9DXC0_9GAMM